VRPKSWNFSICQRASHIAVITLLHNGKKLIRENSVLILNSNVMKELSFEKMENLNGGIMNAYCATLAYWVNGGDGYQGDQIWLWKVFTKNCDISEYIN
jgi:hypothetical protein